MTAHGGAAIPPRGWGAHAGLGRRRPGGTPTLSDLRRIADANLGYVELDVLATADGHLVVRHDRTVSRDAPRHGAGRDRVVQVPAAAMTLATLRALAPETITLTEAVAVLGISTPLMLDLKGDKVATPLRAWLDATPGAQNVVTVCTDSVAALREMRRVAPDVPRLLTFPDLPTQVQRPGWSVVRSFLRDGTTGELISAARAAAHAIAHRRTGGTFSGIPWRPYLHSGLRRARDEVGAAGLCVHHWLITRELVEAARDLGLPITAYTVNDRFAAQRVIGLGVTSITSDDPVLLRRQLPTVHRGARHRHAPWRPLSA